MLPKGMFGSCLQQLRSNQRLRAVVTLAVLGDMIFFALHTAHTLAGTRFDPGQVILDAGLGAGKFSIETDQGYAEWFEYSMLALIIMAFARLALTARQPVYFALLFIFIYYLADDSLQIHENFGATLIDAWGLMPSFGLRAQDFGEMGTWALFGVPLLGFLAFALHRSTGRHRTVGLTLTGWIFVLAFFGGVVDMISILTVEQGALHHIVAFAEDGGEMAVITVILAMTLSVPAFLREKGSSDDAL